MNRILSISIALSIAACLDSCRGCQGEVSDPMAGAVAKLAENGIVMTAVEVRGNEVVVAYEASNANQYDDQILAAWGAIFGVMSWFADDKVTIVNTAGGVPMVAITASVNDIQAVTSDRMNREEFLAKLKIKSLDGNAATGR